MNVVPTRVGVRALRLELSRYLAEVEQGKELIVTDRDRPIARLIPVRGSSDERLAELIRTGDVEPAEAVKDDWLPDPIDLAEGVSISDLVSEQRR